MPLFDLKSVSGILELCFVICVIGCMVYSLQLLAQLHNRTLLGCTRSQWKDDGTASRAWYILAVRGYTQKWVHSTYLSE